VPEKLGEETALVSVELWGD